MKKLFGLVLLVLLAISITACGGSSDTVEPYEVENKQEQEEKEVADSFLKKVKKEDFDDLKSCVYVPGGAIISNDDIKWLIPRSDFSVTTF